MARILISMKDSFLETLDMMAQKEQRSRSELIREALRSYMKKSKLRSPMEAKKNADILEKLID